MRRAHRFRPSESWVLEERVALSATSPPAIVDPAVPLHGFNVAIHGKLTTFLPQSPGAAENAHLSSRPSLPLFGRVRLAGDLSSNGSLPPPGSGTHGTITIISKRHPGVLTVRLTGPTSDLAPAHPTTTHYTYKVVAATGQFQVAAGGRGVADLTLKTQHPLGGNLPPNIAHGSFLLQMTES